MRRIPRQLRSRQIPPHGRRPALIQTARQPDLGIAFMRLLSDCPAALVGGIVHLLRLPVELLKVTRAGVVSRKDDGFVARGGLDRVSEGVLAGAGGLHAVLRCVRRLAAFAAHQRGTLDAPGLCRGCARHRCWLTALVGMVWRVAEVLNDTRAGYCMRSIDPGSRSCVSTHSWAALTSVSRSRGR